MKALALASLIGLIGAPLIVSADPTPVVLTFTCPNTTGVGMNTLSNFGARIAGYGTLVMDGDIIRPPYFTYGIPPGANIPTKINTGGYISSGTDYEPTEGLVSCSYTSPTFDPFTVRYQLTNGTGGTINSQTANTIEINQFIGLRRGSLH